MVTAALDLGLPGDERGEEQGEGGMRREDTCCEDSVSVALSLTAPDEEGEGEKTK